MLKVLIADDHPVVRRGLKQIVADSPDVVVAGEATTMAEVLDKVGGTDYDVVLLDITMPDGNGLDILKDLKRIKPKTHILMLSIHPEERYALRVLKSGGAGYLTKDSAPEELINAIRKVALGGKYISPALAELLACHLEEGTDDIPHELLSNREFQVMIMIASGKTVKQIAEGISLSVKTISTYRSRILDKMNMKSNLELTRYAIENHLVD